MLFGLLLLLLGFLEIALGAFGKPVNLIQHGLLDALHLRAKIDDGQVTAAIFGGVFILLLREIEVLLT